MERKNDKKRLWRQIVAALLIVCLATALFGCSAEQHSAPQTEEKTVNVPAEPLDAMEKVVAYVEDMARAGAEEFSIVCTEEIYNKLVRVSYQSDGFETCVYHSLLDQSGLYSYNVVTAGLKRTLTVSKASLYPGYEILRSIENGTESKLSSKLKQTLTEAQAMAEACRSDDPLETAKNIQAAICEKVRYAYMTNRSDVDTAIGPLVRGSADCDGYADAFYLVGTLAGLEVRYQEGISSSYDHEKHKIVTGRHMWNLLKLDGTWRVVDVCWADSEKGIDYTWFNIGKDRASRSRTWHEELSVPLLETTDLSTRPETEYSVTNSEELETAIKEAIEQKQPSFTIIFDNKNYGSLNDTFDMMWNYYKGEPFYYWDECSRALTIILEGE